MEGEMASDYNAAGVTVSHNLYVLRSVIEDLIQGYYSSASEHFFIAASKADLELCCKGLIGLLGSINQAETSRTILASGE
jgi:hypothetical protein